MSCCATIDAKQKYHQLCLADENIPIYSQAWWLDTVCGKNHWDVCLVEKESQILAAMPYHTKHRWGFKILGNPPLTQTLGIWVSSNIVGTSVLVDELYAQLIQQLPHYDKFSLAIHHSSPPPAEFIKQGFVEAKRVTQVITDLSNLDAIQKNFKRYIRRNIKKAQSQIEVVKSYDMSKFFTVHSQLSKAQGFKLGYDDSFLTRLVAEAKKRNACHCLFAQDSKKNIHSVLMAVSDKHTLYMLVGSSDLHLRKSGADYLLYWEMMKFAHTHCLQFDFEGSMLPNIYRRNHDFGALPKYYSQLIKTSSPLLSLYLNFVQFYRSFRDPKNAKINFREQQ